MKKNIQSQMEELIERMDALESRMDEVEPQSQNEDLSDDVAYKFTQEQFEEFLVKYTEYVTEKIVSEIEEMDMIGEEELYEIEINGKEIEVSVSGEEVSKYIHENLPSLDSSDVVGMAHETLDDLNIDYTIH
jgi:hypothetical protein